MGFIVGGVIAGAGALFGAKKAAKNAWHARNAAQVQAWQDQVANENAAKKQAEQTATLQAQQQEFETTRTNEQNRFNAERQAAAEASARQQAADAATSSQNQMVSELTPDVQLATNASDDASSAAARKRRAQFRPEYTSGVTI